MISWIYCFGLTTLEKKARRRAPADEYWVVHNKDFDNYALQILLKKQMLSMLSMANAAINSQPKGGFNQASIISLTTVKRIIHRQITLQQRFFSI